MPGSDEQALARWWQGFKDRHLDSLIDRALRGNLDLRAADDRLLAARAQGRIVAAGLWPGLNASGSYQRTRISPNALKGLLGTSLGGGLSNATMGPLGTPFNFFQTGFDSAWELDLFGGLRRQDEAAQANAAAAEESRRDLRITISAEVARSYLDLIALHRRLDIARQRVDNQRKLAHLTSNTYQEGWASRLDVQRAQAEQEKVQAEPPTIAAQIDNTRHGLALLLGLQPDALSHELVDVTPAIPSPPAIPAGLPADVLRRRPDIRQAERGLASATASVGAAVAELFPKITLTGSVGLQSQELSNFVNPSSGFYGFGPRLSLPIFQAGRLLAQVDAQEAQAAEALKLYEKTVLTAFREVEDALASLDGERQRRLALAAAEATARTAAATALALYTEGEAELQTVLDANRAWYDAEDQLTLNELAWASGHIALCKALGGGWSLRDGP